MIKLIELRNEIEKLELAEYNDVELRINLLLKIYKILNKTEIMISNPEGV